MLTELRRALPDVCALPGSAEAIPLPDGSVDSVLAGNAMHWFDMAVAGPEIARVLVPGGILAGLWNVIDDRAEWVAELARVSGSAAIGPRDTSTSWRAERQTHNLPKAGVAARFGSPSSRVPTRARRTADSLVATLATRAGMLVMSKPEQERTLGRIRAFLASRPGTARGEFTLPMLTGVCASGGCESLLGASSAALALIGNVGWQRSATATWIRRPMCEALRHGRLAADRSRSPDVCVVSGVGGVMTWACGTWSCTNW